jgi:hypothetical protein
MKKTNLVSVLIAAVLALPLAAFAQTSPNYQNQEHVFNSGGNPTPALISTNFSITLSSIGESLSATGMSSAGYRLEGGFVPPYPPPGEVLNLLFTNKTSFGWNPETSVGTYNVYRGVVSTLPANYGTCLASGLTLTQTTDATIPSAGQCFFYLITAENRLTEEGTMGKNSAGTPHPNVAPCP